MSKTSYYVTDRGGPRPDIAGKRRKAGETITLTAKEAEFELSRGMIMTQADYDASQQKDVTDDVSKPSGKGK